MTSTPQALINSAIVSANNALTHWGTAGGLRSLHNVVPDLDEALKLLNAPPAPPTPQPNGLTGVWNLVFDEDFVGAALDTSAWDTHDGWTNQNGVTDHASNVSLDGNSNLVLTLASQTSGAAVQSKTATLGVGQFPEARIDFAGNGTYVYDWPAWWASGPSWPQAGENDIAEGLDTLTVNYHSPQGANNSGTVPGIWVNGFHTFGIHRLSDHCDVYYDGQMVRTYLTHDNGQPESLILTIGYGGGTFTPAKLLVDYVRVWS